MHFLYSCCHNKIGAVRSLEKLNGVDELGRCERAGYEGGGVKRRNSCMSLFVVDFLIQLPEKNKSSAMLCLRQLRLSCSCHVASASLSA